MYPEPLLLECFLDPINQSPKCSQPESSAEDTYFTRLFDCPGPPAPNRIKFSMTLPYFCDPSLHRSSLTMNSRKNKTELRLEYQVLIM